MATRLGVNPNALYTYVESRAALERELVERVLAESEIALLAAPNRPWRVRILDYALALRTTMLRHPAVALLIMTAPMDGPTALLVGERLIEAFTEGGLEPADASRASYALMVQVLGFLALEVAETEARPPLPDERQRVAERLAALEFLDADDWPMTTATRDVTAQWISDGTVHLGGRTAARRRRRIFLTVPVRIVEPGCNYLDVHVISTHGAAARTHCRPRRVSLVSPSPRRSRVHR